MRRIKSVFLAELTGRLRDKSFWLEALLLPLIVSVILGLALSGMGSGKVPPIRVVIVSQDPEAIPVQVLTAAFGAVGSIHADVSSNVSEARQLLEQYRADALVLIPEFNPVDDSAAISLTVSVEGSRTAQFHADLVAQVSDAALRSMAADLTARRVVANTLIDRGMDPSPAWMTEMPAATWARLREVPLERFDLLGAQFAGLVVFFSLLSAFRMMSLIYGEARRGLMGRLHGSPVHPLNVAAGNILAVAVVSIVQTTAVLLLADLGFGVDWGPVLPLLLAAVVSALSSAAVALALAVLPGSAAVRGLVGLLMVLGGSVLGGSFIPVDTAGPIVTALAKGTLHFWVSGLLTGLSRGLTLADLQGALLGVLFYGGAALLAATVFLGRRRSIRA